MTTREKEEAYEKANRDWLKCRNQIAILKERERKLEKIKNEAYVRFSSSLRAESSGQIKSK